MSRYKRVVLDESSDGGDNSDSDDCNGVSDNDNDASVSDNSSALSGNESYLFDGNENKKNSLVYKNVVRNFDASNSARDLSDTFSHLNLIEKNDTRWQPERSSSIGTYVEDSFLVKDSDYEEDSFLFKNSEQEPCFGPRDCEKDGDSQMQVKPREEPSKNIRNMKHDGKAEGMLEVLAELYPELQNNSINVTDITRSDKNEKQQYSSVDDKENGDSDESFEKYIKKLSNVDQMTKVSRVAESDDDINKFIVNDDEISFISFKDGSDKENGSIEECITRNNTVSLKYNKNHSNLEDEYENQSWHHIHTKKKPRKGLIRIRGKSSVPSLKQIKICSTADTSAENFLLALAPNGPKCQEAEKFLIKKFSSVRDELTEKLFHLYDKFCFQSMLESKINVKWNVRMTKTAGHCVRLQNNRAAIELSSKVCNSADRVRDTLLHELCHAAVWVIDCCSTTGHGPAWLHWVKQCENKFPALPKIERCHNYEIQAKYHYVCSTCKQTIVRHSKSLDTTRKICGICSGRFVLQLNNVRVDLTQSRNNKFANFVKMHYASERKAGKKHGEVMKILSRCFKEVSEAAQ